MSSTIQFGIRILGNSLNFLLGEGQILTSFLGERSLGFKQVEEVKNRLKKIVDLMGKRRREFAIL